MPYYPKSQIKTNLYATPDDYLTTSTNQPRDFANNSLEGISPLIYKGPYYEISTGKKFTGKFPNSNNNLELFPISRQYLFMDFYPDEEKVKNIIDLDTNLIGGSAYLALNSNSNKISYKRSLPLFSPGRPTPKEAQEGSFTRYFCKKTNELIYIEIDKITYNKLSQKDSQIAWDLYTPISILWLLKGDKELIYTSNKSVVESIEKRLKWLGFSQYFQDKFLKYYQSPTINDLYTSGGEFTTQNGQNYIGYYHLHKGTIPMVGKNHVSTPHEVLIPVINPSGSFIANPNPGTSSPTPGTSPTYGSNSSNTGGGGSY